mmetsp:Transcript_10141/g.25786  ORF Transcript_10141/g.25786 Transcript_10141/m.25786 type:complete len:273 (-) Transcript_10141:106-924(-)
MCRADDALLNDAAAAAGCTGAGAYPADSGFWANASLAAANACARCSASLRRLTCCSARCLAFATAAAAASSCAMDFWNAGVSLLANECCVCRVAMLSFSPSAHSTLPSAYFRTTLSSARSISSGLMDVFAVHTSPSDHSSLSAWSVFQFPSWSVEPQTSTPSPNSHSMCTRKSTDFPLSVTAAVAFSSNSTPDADACRLGFGSVPDFASSNARARASATFCLMTASCAFALASAAAFSSASVCIVNVVEAMDATRSRLKGTGTSRLLRRVGA